MILSIIAIIASALSLVLHWKPKKKEISSSFEMDELYYLKKDIEEQNNRIIELELILRNSEK